MKVVAQRGKVKLLDNDGNEIVALPPNEARRIALAIFQHADRISKANKRWRKRKK